MSLFAHGGKDLNIDTLSEEIANMVISETFLNKEVLTPRIRALLSAYIKKVDAPKRFNKKPTSGLIENYVRTIYVKDIESKFWRDATRAKSTEKEMKDNYDKLNFLKSSNSVHLNQKQGCPLDEPYFPTLNANQNK